MATFHLHLIPNRLTDPSLPPKRILRVQRRLQSQYTKKITTLASQAKLNTNTTSENNYWPPNYSVAYKQNDSTLVLPWIAVPTRPGEQPTTTQEEDKRHLKVELENGGFLVDWGKTTEGEVHMVLKDDIVAVETRWKKRPSLVRVLFAPVNVCMYCFAGPVAS